MNGHKVVAEHQIHRHGMEQVVIDANLAQIHKLAAVSRSESFRLGDFVHRVRELCAIAASHGKTSRKKNDASSASANATTLLEFLGFLEFLNSSSQRIRQ